MGSPMEGDHLPPDPYIALGLAKDATTAAIKTQYRKLALKFHPDKVTDESQKGIAADQFHKIQTAYEIVGDEERRSRYDAQCKLAALRKEMMNSGRESKPHVDVRTAAYKMPTESQPRGDFYARGPDRTRVSPQYAGTPQYETRTPQYAQYASSPPDYFDIPPRPTARKEPEYERSAKRAPPRDEREKPRSSPKENERSSRKEKSRRTERDIKRDRESKKQTYVMVEEDSESESDYERTQRRMREEDELKRAKEQYRQTARRQQEEAENGYYPDERARKMFSQGLDASEYIKQSTARTSPRERPEPERRPSPVRNTSSKDKVESIKRDAGGRPSAFRRESGRTKTTGRDTEKKSSSHKKESTKEPHIVDEPQARRTQQATQPPPFVQSKSSPPEIRPPFERQRSKSVEEQYNIHEQIPSVKRSETMPQQQHASHSYDSRRDQSSKLRAEVRDGYLTPERSPEPQGRRYQYGQHYADDNEFATPEGFKTDRSAQDGYRTEVREPERATRQTRVTRSPSPMKEQRGRQRTGSAQHAAPPQPPQMPRTQSYTYKYNGNGQGVQEYSRPAPSRENSGRNERPLYGEIDRDTRSPRQSQSKYSPPEQVHYSRQVQPENVKYQTGYTSRRAGVSRTNNGQQPVYVR